jgi:CheY-like chemotaxis protein
MSSSRPEFLGDVAAPDAEARRPGAAPAAPPPPRVLLLDLEPMLGALLAEWLAGLGLATVAASANDPESLEPAALAVVDVAFPRQDGERRLRALAQSLHGTPLLALSPTFFAGVAANGSVAQRLGVAEVLPTPVRRDDLIAAVRRLVPVAA